MHPSTPVLVIVVLVAAAVGFVFTPDLKLRDGTHAPASDGSRWARAFAFGGVAAVAMSVILGIWP